MVIENLAKLSRPSRSAISAALIIIAAIAMYNWIVAPHCTYLLAAQQYGSIADSIAKKNRVISGTIQIKRKKLQELQIRLGNLQSTLFSPKEAREFFSDLQAISEQAECAVTSLNFVAGKPTSEDKHFKSVSHVTTKSAVLRVVGIYGSMIKLLDSLQARSQKVWIDSLEMTALDKSATHVKCDITITVYISQDKETAS